MRREEAQAPIRGTGGPDLALGRFAQPGLDDEHVRSADLESAMPNFARRHRGKPTYIPAEMQTDYEAGDRKKGRGKWSQKDSER